MTALTESDVITIAWVEALGALFLFAAALRVSDRWWERRRQRRLDSLEAREAHLRVREVWVIKRERDAGVLERELQERKDTAERMLAEIGRSADPERTLRLVSHGPAPARQTIQLPGSHRTTRLDRGVGE